MKRIEYRFTDKSRWKRGEWDTEPDKVQWQDELTGLPCLVRRSPATGAWCGYVGVAEGHPLFEKKTDDCDENLSVHGGVTFNSFCDPDPAHKEHGICHLVEPSENDRVWWIGFDCGHSGDYMPEMARASELMGEQIPKLREFGNLWDRPEMVYRNLAYVQAECRFLAVQLVAIANPGLIQALKDAGITEPGANMVERFKAAWEGFQSGCPLKS